MTDDISKAAEKLLFNSVYPRKRISRAEADRILDADITRVMQSAGRSFSTVVPVSHGWPHPIPLEQPDRRRLYFWMAVAGGVFGSVIGGMLGVIAGFRYAIGY